MSAEEFPVTTGVRFLRARGIPFVPRLYPFEEHGGTGAAARALSVPEHSVIKTLVIRADAVPLKGSARRRQARCLFSCTGTGRSR